MDVIEVTGMFREKTFNENTLISFLNEVELVIFNGSD